MYDFAIENADGLAPLKMAQKSKKKSKKEMVTLVKKFIDLNNGGNGTPKSSACAIL